MPTTRTNTIPNPSFEVAVSPWSSSGSGVVATRSTEWARSGNSSARLTVTSGSTQVGDLRLGSSAIMPEGFEAGKTYTVTAYIYMPTAPAGPDSSSGSRQRRFIVFFSSNGTTVFTPGYGPQAPATAGVHRISHTFTVPENTVGMILGVGVAGSPADPTFVTYVDDVLVEEGTTAGDYLDGSMPDAGGLTYWWTGTPNASPSIEARMLTATPDVSAGSVELEVATDPADYPREIVNRTAGSIYAEWERYGPAWSFGGTTDSVTRVGDLVAAYSPNSTALTLELTGLVVGRRTVVTLGAQRTSTATQFGIMFGPTGAIPAGAGVWDHVLEFTPTATTETLYINRYANSNPMIRSLSVIDYPPDYDEARFALTRTDANGVRSVRLMAGQQIIAGTLLVTDHEAALTGPVTYRLTTPTGATATAVVTLDGAPAMLAPAIFPQYAVPDVFVTGYEAGRASATVVHEVIGRSDPVTRYAPFKARRGRLVYLCMSYAELVALLDVYRRGEVVLLRQPVHAGLDLYHVATGVREVPADDVFRRWALEVEFVEVAWPRAPLAGAAGWTWDDVVEQFATWDDVAAYFATWNELQIGRTT